MKILVLLILASVALVACLPNVSTELPEAEARAILERDVLTTCRNVGSQAIINNAIAAIGNAEALATRDNWIFKVRMAGTEGELEALVFPSRVVSGSFIVQLQTRTCR